jgi:flagellar biosynthesis protein FliP
VTARRARWATVAAGLLLGAVGTLTVGATLAAAAPLQPGHTVVAAPLPTSPNGTEPGVGQDTGSTTGPGAGTAVQPPTAPAGPLGPVGPQGGQNSELTVQFGDKPSTPILVLLGLTVLSLAPAILLTCTSFTKILVVLGLTRNALGLQQTPPNQVLAGLALFLSVFIMAPVLTQVNDQGLQPFLNGDKQQAQAWDDGIDPLRDFMLRQTGDEELALLTNVADKPLPDNREDVALSTLVPSFVLSELKQAFIIGFVIFIPFLVIDIVVSAALMSLGMMMMPPVMVSLPFKLLLFVLVDGWGLVVESLVASYG